MRAAIYARVSTERQERQQTIGSQVSALRDWASTQGHVLIEAHVFRDEGFSGSRLDRPALDALRDAIRDAAIDIVVVFSPDRLARRYAYQVLLMEEFRRAGCEVVFLHRPISDDPNDQLLLQIQGAIAEYERAVLAERFRRGKLQKARDGNIISSKVPYGYRYEGRSGAIPARLVIDEAEAAMVRQLYSWMLRDGLTIRQCMKRLNAGPWITRSGRAKWSSSVVHHILTDPVYTGTAYANRFDYAIPSKPRRRSHRGAERTSRRLRPREQWIAIPAPPLVDQQTWDGVAAALARNATLSFRRNKKNDYLLRCLLKCGNCGLGIHGCVFPGHGGRAGWRYYRCAGTDPLNTARDTKCPRARIGADALEQAVWDHVVDLLGNPAQLRAQFERFLAGAGDIADSAAGHLRSRLERLDRANRRLLDAYQAEVITLDELSSQRRALFERRQLAEQQYDRQRRLDEQRLQAHEALTSLAAFSERVGCRLRSADLGERQTILRLVIERIIVHDDTLEIQHVIPLRGHVPGNELEAPADIGLRSDGVRPTKGQGRCIVRRVGDQTAKPGVTIDLKQTPETFQMAGRMLAFAIFTISIRGGRMTGSQPGTVIDSVAPQPPGLGAPAAWVQHGQGRVIGRHLG
jgi:site-specific DNA recombinase